MLTIHQGRDDITPALRELLSKLADFTEPLKGIGQELESRISARFETQSDPSGSAWHPWSDSYESSYPWPDSPAAKKAGKAGNGRILDRYGNMLASLNHQITSADTVLVGFGSDYAIYHEHGTHKMPRRGIMFEDPEQGQLTQEDEQAMIDIVYTWLELD